MLGPLHTAARAFRIAHCARDKAGLARNTCIGDPAPGCPVRRAYEDIVHLPAPCVLDRNSPPTAFGSKMRIMSSSGGQSFKMAALSSPASSGLGRCLSPRCCDVVRCRRADDRRWDLAPGEDVQVHSLSVSDAIDRSRSLTDRRLLPPAVVSAHHSARHRGAECPLGFSTCIAWLGLSLRGPTGESWRRIW